MERTIRIYDSAGKVFYAFTAYNTKPENDLRRAGIEYLYHQLIYGLLALAADHTKLSAETSFGSLEHWEGYGYLMAPEIVDTLSEHNDLLAGAKERIQRIQPKVTRGFGVDWKPKIASNHPDWLKIRSEASQILNEIGVSPETNLDVYEDRYVGDESFFE